MLQILRRSVPPSSPKKRKEFFQPTVTHLSERTPIDCRHTWPATKLEWQTGRFGHEEFVSFFFFSFVDRLLGVQVLLLID